MHHPYAAMSTGEAKAEDAGVDGRRLPSPAVAAAGTYGATSHVPADGAGGGAGAGAGVGGGFAAGSPMPAGLRSLGDDALVSIFQFLDGKSLGTCEMVSKQFKSIAGTKRMWRHALMADFRLSRSQRYLTAVPLNPRAAYRRRCQALAQRQFAEQARREMAAENISAYHRMMRVNLCLHLGCYFPQFATAVCALPIFFIMLVLFLNDTDKFGGKSWPVLLPLDIAVSFAAVTRLLHTFVQMCASCRSRQRSRTRRFHGSRVLRVGRPACRAIMDTDRSMWRKLRFDDDEDEHFSDLCSALAVAAVAVWPFLLHFRIDGVVTFSWQYVMVPVYVSFVLAAASAMFGQAQEAFGALCATACFAVPVLACVAAVKDGADIDLELVLVPVWVLGGLTVLGSFVGCLIVCREEGVHPMLVVALVFGWLLGVAGLACYMLPPIFITLQSHNKANSVDLGDTFIGVVIMTVALCCLGCTKLEKYRSKFFRDWDANDPARDLVARRGGGGQVFGHGGVP